MRTPAQIAVLVAASVVCVCGGWVVAVRLGFVGDGEGVAVVAALLVCLLPAAATLHLAGVVRRVAPQYGPVAVLVGTGLRMVVAVVGVVSLAGDVSRHGVPRERFARWVAFSYTVTLTAECALLVLAERAGKGRDGESSA